MRAVAGLALVLAAAPSVAEDKPNPYLKGGRLAARVEVVELQGGFAGFTGTYYAVEPDGAWSTGPVSPNARMTKGKPDKTGKLTADGLAALAEALAAFDLAKLPSHGKPEVNPQNTHVRFGTKTVTLQPGPAGAGAADKAVRERYDGIASAVKAACGEPKPGGDAPAAK